MSQGGTSSYLRYIQKFRNTNQSKLNSDEGSFNKENQSEETLSQQTSISENNIYKRCVLQAKEKKPFQVYANIVSKEDNRTTVDTKDQYILNQTFSYNNEKEDQFSFATNKDVSGQIKQLMKRLEKEEEQGRETMRALKLLQQQNVHQEDESRENKHNLDNLSSRVFIIEQKLENQISLKDLQEKPRQLLDKDIKELGREMALDIVKLSRKIDQKDTANQKRLENLEQEMKKNKEKLYKLLENERKRLTKQKEQVSRQSEFPERRSSLLKDSFSNILKKLEGLSKEVHTQAKKPLKKVSEKYLTNETDGDYMKQENLIINKINQLEKDLDKIKSNSFLTQNSNHQNILSLSADYGTLSPQNDSIIKKCPSFSKNTFDHQNSIPVSDQRKLSRSAQRLQNSLEKRMSEAGDFKIPKRNHPSQQISKRDSRKPYKEVMNISFSSTSSDYFYDTNKSQNQRQSYHYRKKSGSKSRTRSKNKSTAKKVLSAHRKSMDDLIRVEVRKKNSTQRHTRKPSQTRDLNITDYGRRKEQEMLEKAKRMINLASLNILQTEIRRRSCSTSLRKKGPSRKRSQQNPSNLLLQNIKQNLMRPGLLPQTLKEPIKKMNVNNSQRKERGQFGKTLI